MIFIKIFQKLPQFSGKVPLEHWVSRIAINTCLNQIQAEKVRPELRQADLSEEEAAVIENLAATSDELAPDKRFASRQLVEHLLDGLKPVERLVIDLHYLQGRSVAEIKKITNQPIRYLVYSHHHFDHIAGGKPFKDAGATIVAHQRAKDRLAVLKDPNTPLPDETFSGSRNLQLGGTTLELNYVGLNHSDSTLIMRLPKERILFVVDLAPVGSLPGRAMIDSYPLEWEDTMKKVLAMDWDRLIPGHPGAPGGRLGTKDDVKDILAFLQESSASIQALARQGKCWEPAEKEFAMPKYEKWPGYAAALQFVGRRYCGLWGRGT